MISFHIYTHIYVLYVYIYTHVHIYVYVYTYVYICVYIINWKENCIIYGLLHDISIYVYIV